MTEAQWQAIRAWLMSGATLPDERVIFAEPQPNAPRPKPPFATMRQLGTLTRLGAYDEERLTTTAGQVKRIGQRRLTVDVNIHGTGAITRAQAAQDATERYDVREALDAAGLTVIDRGQLTNLTGILSTQFEERAQFEVIFGLAVETTETPGWIETVEYDATYNDEASPPPVLTIDGSIS